MKARLEKANILILTKEYHDAIEEFKALLQIIPNEWKIHFHLGEVYLKIGLKDEALKAFNKALGLNPKDKNTIKHAIQNIYNATNAMPEYPHSGAAGQRGSVRRRRRDPVRGRGMQSIYNRSIVEEADEKETDEEMDAPMRAASMEQDHQGASLDFDVGEYIHGGGGSYQESRESVERRNESVFAVGPTHSHSLSPTL